MDEKYEQLKIVVASARVDGKRTGSCTGKRVIKAAIRGDGHARVPVGYPAAIIWQFYQPYLCRS